jgi:hypothetical protein
VNRTALALAGAALTFGFALAAAEDDEKPATAVYQGTWVNRKMRSNGPLRCTLQPASEAGDEWSGRFEGKFKGEGFKYDVKFDAKKSASKTDLQGKATIDGDLYEWTGVLKGENFTLKYRSAKGYNGEFTMKKQKGKAGPPKKGK